MKLMIAILYIRSPRILLIFLKLHIRVLLFFILFLADAPLKLGIYLVTQIEVCIVCTERLVCTWYVLSKIFISTFVKEIRVFIYFFKFIKYFDLQDRKKGKKKSPRMNAWSVTRKKHRGTRLRCFGEHASERVVGRWGRGFGSRPRRHYGAASVGLVTLCRDAARFRFLAR